MNSDFEKELQRQEMRKLPPDWKAQILQTALTNQAQKQVVAPSPTILARLQDWTHQLLWPCPQAWAGLAAVWLLIVGFNHFDSTQTRGVPIARAPVTPDVVASLKQQRMLKAELIGDHESGEEPKRVQLQPRSELSLTIVTV